MRRDAPARNHVSVALSRAVSITAVAPSADHAPIGAPGLDAAAVVAWYPKRFRMLPTRSKRPLTTEAMLPGALRQ